MASQRIQRRKTTIDVPDVAVAIFALRQVEAAAKLGAKAGLGLSIHASVSRALYDQLAALPGAKAEHRPKTETRTYEVWRVEVDGDSFSCWEPPAATTTTSTLALPELARAQDAKEAA